jgi:hypothetical protein
LILPRLVHHVYSKHAEVTVPSLDDWEKGWKEKLKAETLKLEMPELKVLPVNFRSAPAESAVLFPRSRRSKPLS